jgi:hypothetical protein
MVRTQREDGNQKKKNNIGCEANVNEEFVGGSA